VLHEGFGRLTRDHACPNWAAKLRLPALSSGNNFAPDRCRRCVRRIARAATRTAPEVVLRFQRRLLADRPNGVVELRGVGMLDWRTNRIKNEALRRFGVGIAVHVAGRPLRKHGPWRRRKALAKRRFTVAPVYD